MLRRTSVPIRDDSDDVRNIPSDDAQFDLQAPVQVIGEVTILDEKARAEYPEDKHLP